MICVWWGPDSHSGAYGGAQTLQSVSIGDRRLVIILHALSFVMMMMLVLVAWRTCPIHPYPHPSAYLTLPPSYPSAFHLSAFPLLARPLPPRPPPPSPLYSVQVLSEHLSLCPAPPPPPPAPYRCCLNA